MNFLNGEFAELTQINDIFCDTIEVNDTAKTNYLKTNYINNIPVNNFLTLSGNMNFVTLDGNQIITGPKQITNLTADKIYCQEFYNNGGSGDINIGHSDGNEGFNINLGGPYVGVSIF